MHGLWPSGGDADNVHGFDPATNPWDPPGTCPDTHGTAGTTRDGATGEVDAAGGA